MNNQILKFFGIGLALSITASINADVITPVSVTAHDGGQTFGTEEEGTPLATFDLSGMVTPDINDPSGWTSEGSWPNEYQSLALLSGAANSKIGWIAYDLGTDYNLETLYTWSVQETSARIAATYNVYYSSDPTLALPALPGEGVTYGDYDFGDGSGSTGWFQVGGTRTGVYQQAASDPIDMTGITAQYVALEILTNGGDANRTGFSEVAFIGTVVPEVSTFAFIGLAGLALFVRRRR